MTRLGWLQMAFERMPSECAPAIRETIITGSPTLLEILQNEPLRRYRKDIIALYESEVTWHGSPATKLAFDVWKLAQEKP